MKVVLALNEVQAKKLQELIDRNNNEATSNREQENIVSCGDIMVYDHGFSFNSDQSIRLDGQRVELTGQRCALAGDGIFEILSKALSAEVEEMFEVAQKLPYDQIAGARFHAWQVAKREFEKVYVVSYETSDSRLKWWERLSDIAEGLTVSELKKMSGEQLGQQSLDDNEQLSRIRELLRKVAKGECNMSAVHAELDKDEMFVFNKMENYLKTTYGYVF